MLWGLRFAIVCAVLASAAAATCARATDWLQFGFDPTHSSYNAAERGYSTADGNRLALPAVTLPSAVDSAPVFVGGVAASGGVKDLLLGVTKDGKLLALDATSGALIWTAEREGKGTLTTGAPAIDGGRQHVYAYGMDGKVHKYKIEDGEEIDDDGWPQTTTLKPDLEKSASALTIATAANGRSYLYAVSNSYFDVGDFQGHLTTIDLDAATQNVFNAQCSDLNMHFVANGVTSGGGQNDCTVIASPRPGQTAGSGIWGRSGAVYDARTDRVYVATGNGLFDPDNTQGNGHDWGDSVLALNADGTGSFTQGMPVDSYTPATYLMLLANDADLGSTSPAILPAPAGGSVAHLAMQGGKDGCVRLLNLDMLGGSPGAGHVGGELQAITLPGTVNHCVDGGNLATFKSQAAVWVNPDDASTWTFIAHTVGIVAYRVVIDGAGNPSLSPMWSSSAAGTSPVVANRQVYYVSSGAVRALDATTGNPIWTANDIGDIHWQSPILVNGRLYVFDESARLWIYELDGIFGSAFE